MPKCALEMLVSTADSREEANVRYLEQKRLEEERLRRETKKLYDDIVNYCLTKFEEEFSQYPGNPADFVCHIGFFDKYDKHSDNFVFEDHYHGYCMVMKREIHSRYADDSPDFNRYSNIYVNVKVLEELFAKLCYKMEVVVGGDAWHYGWGKFRSRCIKLSLDPSCLEKLKK